ncbi:MAG: Hpt domain-containing protein [SAR324 cluster bacterium]|nr:Hpt domain-containing protein [SAR324 cluster bacterium]
MNYIKTWLCLCCLVLAGLTAWASDPDKMLECDSCQFKISNLKEPFPLTGNWLFTRDDLPQNKEPEIDVSSWKIAKTPGPWKKIYGDHQNFRVGWYRANLEFEPSLIGTIVLFQLECYMSRVQVFLDGNIIFERTGKKMAEQFYAIQPIPVLFKITQPSHVLTFRVDTMMMTGVYQVPFDLREYDDADWSIALRHFWSGDLRQYSGVVMLFFGLFFLLVYSKTRALIYLVAGMTGVMVIPFAIAPADVLLHFFTPESLLMFSYVGIITIYPNYLFVQFFHRFYTKWNWFWGIWFGLMGLTFLGMAVFHQSLDLFQTLRTVYLLSLAVLCVVMLFTVIRCVMDKKPVMVLLGGTLIAIIVVINDILLGLGLIRSISLSFAGILLLNCSIMWVASNQFADTFVENKRLVGLLQKINESLEDMVAERTAQLRQKTVDIQSMLANLQEGIMAIGEANKIHPEYSAFVERIFDTENIANRDVLELVFTDTNLGPDQLNQLDTAIGSCIQEDVANFICNRHLFIQQAQKEIHGKTRHLDFTWSPICNENEEIEKILLCVRDVTELKYLQAQALEQRTELEMIGEILALSSSQFQAFLESGDQFIRENKTSLAGQHNQNSETLDTLFRNMHTLKGNARTYGLTHLTDVTHQAEQSYDQLRKRPDQAWNIPRLLEELTSVEQQLNAYRQIYQEKLEGFVGEKKDGILLDQSLLSIIHQIQQTLTETASPVAQALQNVLKAIHTHSLKDILSELLKGLTKLAHELGKRPPLIELEDQGIRWSKKAAPWIKDIFVHLFRNAMDHGIEQPQIRTSKGKQERGTIRCHIAYADQNTVELLISDDGQGLHLDRLRAKAIEQGIATDPASISDTEAAELIFISGVSTTDKVSEISGRGVGMDAVRKFVQKQGGDVRLILATEGDNTGRPFHLRITLPADLTVKVT